MKPTTMIPIAFTILTVNLVADGLRDWQKNCYACHKEIAMGAKLKTSEEWGALFANEAEKLRVVHEKTPDALERIDSSYFKRHQRTLRNILMDNASDQGGLIRTCDGAATKC